MIASTTRALLATLMACSFTNAALADKPVKEHFSFFEAGFPIVECDGFDVLSDSTIEGFFFLNFDADGNLVSARLHQAFVDNVWYNSEYPDIMIEAGPGQVINERYDFLGDPPTVIAAGLSAKATVPGYGIVFVEAGTVLIDLTTDEVLYNRGPADFYEGNGDVICSILSS